MTRGNGRSLSARAPLPIRRAKGSLPFRSRGPGANLPKAFGAFPGKPGRLVSRPREGTFQEHQDCSVEAVSGPAPYLKFLVITPPVLSARGGFLETLVEPVGGGLAGVDLVEGPVRLLGPLALVDDRLPVVLMSTRGATRTWSSGTAAVLVGESCHGVGEQRQEAADDPLLLVARAQRASSATVVTREASSSASPGSCSPRTTRARMSAMASPSCLQGVHWPQDSTARNRATPAATAARSSPSEKTMNPAAPRPGAGRLHRSVAERRVELVAGQERVGHAGQDRLDRARRARRWSR